MGFWNRKLKEAGVKSFMVTTAPARYEFRMCFTIANNHQSKNPMSKFKSSELETFKEVVGCGQDPKWYIDVCIRLPSLGGRYVRV